jgi:hypothetical protein
MMGISPPPSGRGRRNSAPFQGSDSDTSIFLVLDSSKSRYYDPAKVTLLPVSSLGPSRYQPFYCEENVYHLCVDPCVRGEPRAVVWLTNRAQELGMAWQKAASSEDEIVVWDYHVMLLSRQKQRWRVWDPDSRLRFGLGLTRYLEATFPSQLPARLAPCFRLVPAPEYRIEFASDRRHMRHPSGGWRHPPPPWPKIGQGHTLPRFLALGGERPGVVTDLGGLKSALERLFSSSGPA